MGTVSAEPSAMQTCSTDHQSALALAPVECLSHRVLLPNDVMVHKESETRTFFKLLIQLSQPDNCSTERLVRMRHAGVYLCKSGLKIAMSTSSPWGNIPCAIIRYNQLAGRATNRRLADRTQ